MNEPSVSSRTRCAMPEHGVARSRRRELLDEVINHVGTFSWSSVDRRGQSLLSRYVTQHVTLPV